MADAPKQEVKPMELCVKVLCGGSLTLCIESVQFELDPVKKLDKVKKKGRYLDLPYGPSLRFTKDNVARHGFSSVPAMLQFLAEQLPRTAEGRKSGPAFLYAVALGPQTVPPESMDLGALRQEIEARTRSTPSHDLSREGAVKALNGLREICAESVPFVPGVVPPPLTKDAVAAKERTLVEDLFARYQNTAGR